MIYEINFESFQDAYAPYLMDRYGPRGLPEVFGDLVHEHAEKEYLRDVQDKYTRWVSELLRVRCEDAGLIVAPMDASLGDNFVAPSDILDTWVGQEYQIVFRNKDDVCVLLSVLDKALHEHGVESEMHDERGLIDRETRDAMFKAMVVDNILGELRPIVEDYLSDYRTVESEYGSLLAGE